jgi:hypothetical protein
MLDLPRGKKQRLTQRRRRGAIVLQQVKRNALGRTRTDAGQAPERFDELIEGRTEFH